MTKTKDLILHIIVAIISILIIFLFFKIFTFKNFQQTPSLDVNNSLVNQLYNNIPRLNNSKKYFYTIQGAYPKRLTNSDILAISYNYASNNNFLEDVDQGEISTISAYKKISKKNLEDAITSIFGKIEYNLNDFEIDYKTKALYANEYFYIYEEMPKNIEDNVVYNFMKSYMVLDNGNTIKIYDYYLKCDKLTKVCYNDEGKESANNYLMYSENLKITEQLDKIKSYEHTFEYSDGMYHWVSSVSV